MLIDTNCSDENMILILDRLTSMIGSVHRNKIKIDEFNVGIYHASIGLTWRYVVGGQQYSSLSVNILPIDNGKVYIPGRAMRKLKKSFYRTLKGVK